MEMDKIYTLAIELYYDINHIIIRGSYGLYVFIINHEAEVSENPLALRLDKNYFHLRIHFQSLHHYVTKNFTLFCLINLM